MILDVIALDADDTLWENEGLYSRAKSKLKELLSNYHSIEWIGQALDEIEVRNIGYYGYGIKSFALSMIETAIELSGGRIEGRDIQKIIEIVKDMLAAEVVLFEHTQQALEKLSASHDLMLITKGDQFEQERKIQRSGVARFFRYIEIVGDKSQETYRAILDKYGLDPKCFLMVGNSIRSDILPVIGVGGRAVYIPCESTWFHETEVEDEVENYEYDELEHIGQLPGYVEELEKRSR